MQKIDPVLQIRNFKSTAQVSAYERWHKKIPDNLRIELDKKKKEIFCLSMDPKSALENSFWEQVWLYEKFLTEKNKRTTRAQYTRRAVKKYGIKQFLENLMLKPKTFGLKLLEETDELIISYEQVVLKHQDDFNSDVIKSAQSRVSKS